MFFPLSKILWVFIDPGNVLIFCLLSGVILSWTRWRRAARWLLSGTALFALLLAIAPVGETLILKLENRFPRVVALPDEVEGIIVLGGVIDQFVSKDRGAIAINGAVERLTEFAKLARKYPRARLVFSGGSGVLRDQSLKEAHFVIPVIKDLGINKHRIVLEDQSRNTYENALFSKKIVQPSDEGQWILITSAFHMPRATGVFRKTGWEIIPYPVDYHMKYDGESGMRFDFRSGVNRLASAMHEWTGLTFYWFSGYMNELFPGPRRVHHLTK